MRIELAGSLIRPEPLVIRYESDLSFDTAAYIELGFTHFEVICIGAGGGHGGGIDTTTLIRNFGGEGGGGGFHRVRGLLSALPISCDVVVGAAGANGSDHVSNPALTTDGTDGGYSSFNDTTCRASGGKGGKRAQSNSSTVASEADGGDGGVGDRIIAGGGGDGGIAGVTSTLSTPGSDGTFFNNVGEGGGGGAGGVGSYGGTTHNAASAGGRGSYNPGDTAVYGPGIGAGVDIPSGALIVPGKASGAKAAPLNGLPTVYGISEQAGIVVVRLTAE